MSQHPTVVAADHAASYVHGPAQSPSTRLNWLRAGVLGANDGIVSVAGIVIGVAGATVASDAILTAGVAGWAAGAVSMALGEYVSVSSQRDTERALLADERMQLARSPAASLAALTGLYVRRGLSRGTAETVAQELTERDALAAHAEIELRINPEELTKPLRRKIRPASGCSRPCSTSSGTEPPEAQAADVFRGALHAQRARLPQVVASSSASVH
jgi:VIT1/CCC1 family predicted Fe2+/Mn2+ transporter